MPDSDLLDLLPLVLDDEVERDLARVVVIDRIDHPTIVRLMEREELRIPRVVAISDYPRVGALDLLERIHDIIDLVPLHPRPLKHHLQFLEKGRVYAPKNARRSAQVLRQPRRHLHQHRG